MITAAKAGTKNANEWTYHRPQGEKRVVNPGMCKMVRTYSVKHRGRHAHDAVTNEGKVASERRGVLHTWSEVVICGFEIYQVKEQGALSKIRQQSIN